MASFWSSKFSLDFWVIQQPFIFFFFPIIESKSWSQHSRRSWHKCRLLCFRPSVRPVRRLVLHPFKPNGLINFHCYTEAVSGRLSRCQQKCACVINGKSRVGEPKSWRHVRTNLYRTSLCNSTHSAFLSQSFWENWSVFLEFRLHRQTSSTTAVVIRNWNLHHF